MLFLEQQHAPVTSCTWLSCRFPSSAHVIGLKMRCDQVRCSRIVAAESKWPTDRWSFLSDLRTHADISASGIVWYYLSTQLL